MNLVKAIFLLIAVIVLPATTRLTGQNRALNFDGVNDYVNCGNAVNTQLSGNAITLEAWIYSTLWKPNVWEGNIINKELNGPNNGFMLRTGAGGKLNFNLGNGAWHEITSSLAVLSLNQWHHVAGVYDGSYLRLYVDGVATDSLYDNNVNFADATGKNLTIGSWSSVGRYFEGSIDEVRVWNVARTKSELVSNMNTEICNNEAGLVAYYKFNQGVGAGSNGSVTTAYDGTPNANNGILNGFTLNGMYSNWVNSTSNITPSPFISSDVPAVTSPNPFICIGSPDSAEVVISSGNLNDSQQWRLYLTSCGNGGSTATTGNSFKVKPGNSRKYFVRGEGGCADPGSCSDIVIYVSPAPVFTTSVTDEVFGNDGAIDLTVISGKPPYKFDWNNDGIGDNDDTEDLSGLPGGNYTVIVTDSTKCADTGMATVNPGTAIGLPETPENRFNIYPNPAGSFFYIDLKNSSASFEQMQLVNILGDVVKKYEPVPARKNTKLSLDGLGSGIYFLKFIWQGKAIIEKLIIE